MRLMRRAAFLVSFLGFSAIFAGVIPWSVSPETTRAAVSARLKDLYGPELTLAGRSTFALLPIPRLTLENIGLTAADGAPLVRGGSLRGDLRWSSLLVGRPEIAELSLRDSLIDVDIQPDGGTSWNAAFGRLRERLAAQGVPGHLSSLVFKNVDVRIRDRRTSSEEVVHAVNLAANWPAADGPLDASGSLVWRGQTVELTNASFRPSALASGRPSRIDLQAKAPLGSIAVQGDAPHGEAPSLAGRASFETRSLRDFSRWSGIDLPLAQFVQALALEGDVVADGGTISWPSARLTIAGDRLEGALSVRLVGERQTITGTLAAERLDLTAFTAPLASMRAPEGGRTSNGLDLHRPTTPDLDLRLSASTARIGSIRMDDVAANISLKPDRYEATLGRASVGKGVLKGRAMLAKTADSFELKGQGSFDKLELGTLLAGIGMSPRVGGSAQGQITFDGSGDTAAEVARHLHGRAIVTVPHGEIVGVGLNGAARRPDGKIPQAPTGRGDRIPFEQAHLNVTVNNGMAEIADSGLTTAGLRWALNGRASLFDRNLQANVKGIGPASEVAFEIAGPWDNLAIRHDSESAGRPALIQ